MLTFNMIGGSHGNNLSLGNDMQSNILFLLSSVGGLTRFESVKESKSFHKIVVFQVSMPLHFIYQSAYRG